MKLRADKILYPADKKALMRIQGEAQKNKDQIELENPTIDDANDLLNLYAKIAFDEGYRRAIDEAKEEYETLSSMNKIKAKRRKKGEVHYVEEGDIEKSGPLCMRRLKSKRQRKSRTEYCKDNNIEDSEEWFTITVVIHTFFEAGYLKAQSIEEQAKIMTGDNKETAGLLVDMFKSIFGEQNAS